jgi:hypothetical protein
MGKHEEINPFGEFAKENSNLSTELRAQKKKGASIPDTNYWGLICKAQKMVDA